MLALGSQRLPEVQCSVGTAQNLPGISVLCLSGYVSSCFPFSSTIWPLSQAPFFPPPFFPSSFAFFPPPKYLQQSRPLRFSLVNLAVDG